MEIKVTEKFLNLTPTAQRVLFLLYKKLPERAKKRRIDKWKVGICLDEANLDSSNKARYIKELYEASFIKMGYIEHILDKYIPFKSCYFIELR